LCTTSFLLVGYRGQQERRKMNDTLWTVKDSSNQPWYFGTFLSQKEAEEWRDECLPDGIVIVKFFEEPW